MTTTTSKKSLTNRDNVIRIQYNTSSHKASSLTIEPLLLQLIEAKVGDAEGWLKNKAREVRNALMAEAEELERNNLLIKSDKYGNVEHVTPEDFIRGKVSGQVRIAAIELIADPALLVKVF